MPLNNFLTSNTIERMKKYTYKTETDKKGNIIKYRCWQETFKDNDTGKDHVLNRQEPIEINGEAVRFYSDSELRSMSKSERKEISLSKILN